MPCQDKRRRCFVIITRGENGDVGRQERLYLADASFKTSLRIKNNQNVRTQSKDQTQGIELAA